MLIYILRRGYRIKIRSAITNVITELAEFGFVDNIDLVETTTDEETIMDVAINLQESMDWWEIGANVSVEALVAAKSWGALFDFTWSGGEWSYATEFNTDELIIKESDGRK